MVGSLVRYLRRHHIGLLALVVAMGGTAYAAGTINSRDIADGTLKSKDFKDGSIRGRDVQEDALGSAHINEGTLDDKVYTATVQGGGDPDFLKHDGFTDVKRTAPGSYQLTLEKGAPVACSVGAVFFELPDVNVGDATSIGYQFGAGGQPLITIRDAAGKLTDGFVGFSVVYAC